MTSSDFEVKPSFFLLPKKKKDGTVLVDEESRGREHTQS